LKKSRRICQALCAKRREGTSREEEVLKQLVKMKRLTGQVFNLDIGLAVV
jgi:hypothetical protein